MFLEKFEFLDMAISWWIPWVSNKHGYPWKYGCKLVFHGVNFVLVNHYFKDILNVERDNCEAILILSYKKKREMREMIRVTGEVCLHFNCLRDYIRHNTM